MRPIDPSTDSLALREQAARQEDPAPAPAPEPVLKPSGAPADAEPATPAQDTPAEPEGVNHAG